MSLEMPQTRIGKGEPTLPLINIVFLMLIFFLVVGQMARPLDPSLELVKTDDPELVPPPDAVVLMQDSTMLFRGLETDAESVIGLLKANSGDELHLRLLPDARLEAAILLEAAQSLRAAGAQNLSIIAERAGS